MHLKKKHSWNNVQEENQLQTLRQQLMPPSTGQINSADLIKVILLVVHGGRPLKALETGRDYLCSLSSVPEDEHR